MRSLSEKYQCWFQMTRHTHRQRQARTAQHCTHNDRNNGSQSGEYTACPEGDPHHPLAKLLNSSGLMGRMGQILLW